MSAKRSNVYDESDFMMDIPDAQCHQQEMEFVSNLALTMERLERIFQSDRDLLWGKISGGGGSLIFSFF